jgi:hypothetical protein
MNKILRVALIVIGTLVVAGGLVFAGIWIARWTGYGVGWMQPRYGTMNYDYRSGRGGTAMGPGMMGDGYAANPMRPGGMRAYGMMGDDGYNNEPRGYGMMGGYAYNDSNITPLTIDQAYQAAEKYLSGLNLPDLKIAEVMVFTNNAYVRVVEQSSGIGAFELLVDPATQAVRPEFGPNMMWNLKYGGLNHQEMMGGGNFPGRGMMGTYGSSTAPADVSAEMPVSPDEALKAAQAYLDSSLTGAQTAPDADPFYGYYTIDILRDGKTIGMLSVNGFNGQVFMHTWHGSFIEAQDY